MCSIKVVPTHTSVASAPAASCSVCDEAIASCDAFKLDNSTKTSIKLQYKEEDSIQILLCTIYHINSKEHSLDCSVTIRMEGLCSPLGSNYAVSEVYARPASKRG